ncbi:MAG: hypothetical protein P0Y59_01370 [Candidatus Sphingomonas phytovorans]|nr:hypothetical protein [Sphingomonas sp.]WEK00375.1 MAG: hypothetical protein P0Y59_01370 [Sphingomonas sp.]
MERAKSIVMLERGYLGAVAPGPVWPALRSVAIWFLFRLDTRAWFGEKLEGSA